MTHNMMTGDLRRNEYTALMVVCKSKVNKHILFGIADSRLLNIAYNANIAETQTGSKCSNNLLLLLYCLLLYKFITDTKKRIKIYKS